MKRKDVKNLLIEARELKDKSSEASWIWSALTFIGLILIGLNTFWSILIAFGMFFLSFVMIWKYEKKE